MENLDGIGVYRFISPNGSVYIGMTSKSFAERRKGHFDNFRKGQMSCIGLERAFDKYGIDAMAFEILEDMTGYGEFEILYRERIWWLRHRAWGVNLYNGEPTGRGAVRHTKETRLKISEAGKKRAKPKPTVTCPECGNDFIRRRKTTVFCSRTCLWLSKTLKEGVDYNLATLKSLYLDDEKSTWDIAKMTGITQPAILKILKDSGIAMRNPK